MNRSDESNTLSSPNPGYENVAAAVFVAVLMLLTILGNLFVIASFCMFQELRTICNYFVVSLSAADVLVAMAAMPFWCLLQITSHKWVLSHNLYLFWGCVDILCGTSSTMNLAAVSVDRQCAITMPISYPQLVTSKRAVITILLVWTYAILVSVLRLVKWPVPGYYGYFVSSTSFFLPLAIMLVMYFRIYIIARQHFRRLSRTLAIELKATKTIAVVIGCFVLCWTPFFSLVVIFAYDRQFRISPVVVQVVKWLEYLNSGLNPLIYTCLNRNYRCALKKIFGKLRKARQNKTERTSSWRGRSFSTRNSLSQSIESSGPRGGVQRNCKCFGVELNRCLGKKCDTARETQQISLNQET